MRPYGIPKHPNVESPDLGDIREFGLKSAVGHLRGRGGEYRSHFTSPTAKARTRRLFKRAARAAGRAAAAER